VFSGSLAVGAALRLEVRGEAKLGQIAQILVGDQLDVAAVSAVAAVRPAAGNELLAAEADAAVTAAAALHEDGGAIREHAWRLVVDRKPSAARDHLTISR
jgi:hypothetical protein